MDICSWLHDLNLGFYAPVFEAHAITFEILHELTQEDLRRFGITHIEHQEIIFQAIQAMRKQPETPDAYLHVENSLWQDSPDAAEISAMHEPPFLELAPARPSIVPSVIEPHFEPQQSPKYEVMEVAASRRSARNAPPIAIKPTILQRLANAYRRASGGSLLLSIGVHGAILLIATYFIVRQVTEERKVSFAGGERGATAEIQHTVKRRTVTTAPAPTKRITTTDIGAKVSLPDMPSVNLNMGPTIAGAMGAGGFRMSAGLGSGGTDSSGKGSGQGSGFAKISFFGLRGGNASTSNMMKGVFYDFKQIKVKQPVNASYITDLRDFVQNNWNPSILAKYYHSDVSIYSPRIYVPVSLSDEAPKAFGLEGVVKPYHWAVHYKGKFRARKGGVFRFVGCGDNILIVRLNKENIFDGSGPNGGLIDPKLKISPPELLGPVCAGKLPDPEGKQSFQLTPSKWFTITMGSTYEIEVLIGDVGGYFSAFLLFEEKGANYRKRKNGTGVAYPVFSIDQSPMPKNTVTPGNLVDFNPDFVLMPGIFEATPPGS